MRIAGEWWARSFGDREVQWKLHHAYETCTASDKGERCTEPGAYVVVFTVDGLIGVSTVCLRHLKQWEDEANAAGVEPQHDHTGLPFRPIDDVARGDDEVTGG